MCSTKYDKCLGIFGNHLKIYYFQNGHELLFFSDLQLFRLLIQSSIVSYCFFLCLALWFGFVCIETAPFKIHRNESGLIKCLEIHLIEQLQLQLHCEHM